MELLNILIFLLIFANLVYLGYFVSEYTGQATREIKVLANLTRAIDGDTIL